jgi:hypothetical protein
MSCTLVIPVSVYMWILLVFVTHCTVSETWTFQFLYLEACLEKLKHRPTNVCQLPTVYLTVKLNYSCMHRCCWLQGISYAKLASLPPIIGLCTWLAANLIS